MQTDIGSVLESLSVSGPQSGCSDGAAFTASGARCAGFSPADGRVLAEVVQTGSEDYERVLQRSVEAQARWRLLPAPQRGECVRQLGDQFRRHKDALGALIAIEAGKILSEGLGEVQEMIDICDFAVGLSRQLYGLSMHSERPQHRMLEQWHPLGPVAVVTAFNFPMAVWAWNAMIGAVCGDSIVWKPSPKTPLCALAVQRIAERVMTEAGYPGVFGLVCGGADIGARMAADTRLPLVSFTGSVRAGREIATTVAQRLGRSLLELGGNNGLIVMDDADPDLALRAIVFGAAGTAGQRCTSTRRLFLQRGIAATLKARLVQAYGSIRIGDPLDTATLMGPLIDAAAVDAYTGAIAAALAEGGQLLYGGKPLPGAGHFVEPTLIASERPLRVSREETFAPILYVTEFDTLEQAIGWHNEVPQGLSSALFTRNLQHAEHWLSVAGSDCGIANVNLGTSGAEIGGAFGGEKDTGGGRESGSDAWKAYMRRQTCTINYGSELPLAQGVRFDL